AGVLDAMRPAIEEKSLVLYSLVSQDTARVTGDPSVLQQLMCSLFENAIAFTPARGRIELRLERDGSAAVVAITDGRTLASGENGERVEGSMTDIATVPPDDVQITVAELLDPPRIAAMLEPMSGTFESYRADNGAGMTFAIRLPLRAVASLSAPVAAQID